MADTFIQIYIHLVFAVQGRQSLIQHSFKEELYKYITGIVQQSKRGHKLIALNGPADHIHILIGLNPDRTISDLVREVKTASSIFINKRRLTRGRFSWQKGYGAFSNAHSQLDSVVRYIRRQEEHHARRTFKEEYLKMLNRYHVQYNPAHLFDWIEEGTSDRQ